MGRIKIKFIENVGVIPCIKIKLRNGNAAIALIDSGSDSSVVGADFIRKNKDCFKVRNLEHTVEYMGLYSSNKEELVIAETEFVFNNSKCCSKKAKLCIMDMEYVSNSFFNSYGISPDILLGGDFLKKHNAKIDYKNSTLTI